MTKQYKIVECTNCWDRHAGRLPIKCGICDGAHALMICHGCNLTVKFRADAVKGNQCTLCGKFAPECNPHQWGGRYGFAKCLVCNAEPVPPEATGQKCLHSWEMSSMAGVLQCKYCRITAGDVVVYGRL